MTRLKMLPPVVRHITVPPSPSFARPFIQSKGCELHPKKPLSDGRIPGAFHNLFVSRSRPSIHEDNLADEEADGKCLVKSGGLNFRVTDIAPGVKGDMHKTTSIDFLVLHRGEVVLHLEGGVQKTIKEGEATVQRGTVHAWENPSPDQWVRMFVVLVDADGSEPPAA